MLGTISAFDYRHRETKKNLCRGGRSQDLIKNSIAIDVILQTNVTTVYFLKLSSLQLTHVRLSEVVYSKMATKHHIPGNP